MRNLLFRLQTVYAHCDIPCGIYDPRGAQLAALTIIRMIDLITESSDTHQIARCVVVKEENAELCKKEVRIIWGDYFKEEHFKKYPNLHDLAHDIMQAASSARQGVDRKSGERLLDLVNQLSAIFWETKGVKTKKVKMPHKVEEELLYPVF